MMLTSLSQHRICHQVIAAREMNNRSSDRAPAAHPPLVSYPRNAAENVQRFKCLHEGVALSLSSIIQLTLMFTISIKLIKAERQTGFTWPQHQKCKLDAAQRDGYASQVQTRDS